MTKKKKQKQASPLEKLPKEVQEKLKVIKGKLDKFQKQVLTKFDKYIMGIALLPPPRPKEGEKPDQKIKVLVLVDDSDSKRMAKIELRNKLDKVINSTAKAIDKEMEAKVIILSELWQNGYDGKYDLLRLVAMSAPVFDRGMLAAVKIAELHKSMILKRFEKYIVSYVLAGSLVQGRATPTSDIDVWVVIDDTDVKKMTRAELKDKLRAIIIGMGLEAGDITGIKNKLNIQVYILTDFWDSLKQANPVIFTLLRDGVPFYDRGVFMPWKQLLRMGRIKPSMEAIDMHMSAGEQGLKRARFKLKDIGMEDIFWATLPPSQAALMLYGLPPPTPKETPQVMKDIFVKKEKLLEAKDIALLEGIIKVRKEMEHGTKKEITGKEIDKLLVDADKYMKRIRRLFTQIESIKEKESIKRVYDGAVTIIRDILRLEGTEKVPDIDLVRTFEDKMISTGKIPARYLRNLNQIIKAKKDFDSGKLTKSEIGQTRIQASEFIKHLVEYMQRSRGRALERAKLRVKYGNKYGELTLLEDMAFIVRDIDVKEKLMTKAKIKADGSLGTEQKCTIEDFEKSLAKVKIPKRAFVKEPIFEDLKRLFGKNVEVLVHY